MSELKHFYPSNSDSGMWFTEKWCMNCRRETYMLTGKANAVKCPILTKSYMENRVEDWIYGDDGPECTAFIKREYVGNKGGGYRKLEKQGQQKLFAEEAK